MIKRWLSALLSVVLCAIPAPAEPPRPAPSQEPPLAILGVDELMSKDPVPRTRIAVRGVVSAVDGKQKSLALIDLSEFDRCRVTTCATLILPVSWTGAMPAIGQSVKVEGRIDDADGKLVFSARHLEAAKVVKGKAR